MSKHSSGPVQILLAEDNPGDVRLIREALAEHDVTCDLHVVKSGEEASSFITRIGQPGNPALLDLVVLDLNLPKRSGNDVLRDLRQKPECREVPVIILTSSAAPVDRAEAAALGANRFVLKPSDLEDFLRIGAIAKELVSTEG